MNIFSFFKRARKEEGEVWLAGGVQSASGETVTTETAMQVAAVYSCVRLISQTLATLPCILYREDGNNKDRAKDLPLYEILHYAPNPYQTAVQFFEAMQMNLLLRGNAYAVITFGGDARVRELNMISPDRIKPQIVEGVLRYSVDGGRRYYPASEILHIAGPSLDGINGLSPIDYTRETIGNAQAMQRHSGALWKNGAKLLGILKYPGKLTPQGIENLKASWESQSSGPNNSGKTAILENGMDFVPVTMTTEQSQFIEDRKLSRSDIAGIFNCPPHLIGDLEHATFSNIEQQSLEFVTYTLRPWFVRWESAIKLRLLYGNPGLKAEFNADALLRGDFYTRQQGLAIQRQNGVLSIDEWRALENRNPLPDGKGKDHMVPMNMTPVGTNQGATQDGTPNVAGVSGARKRAHRHLLEKEVGQIINKTCQAFATRKGDAQKLEEFLEKFEREISARMAPAFHVICADYDSVDTAEALSERFAAGFIERLKNAESWEFDKGATIQKEVQYAIGEVDK